MLSSFLFLAKVSLCLFFCPLLPSSCYRRAVPSSAHLCSTFALAREGYRKRDSKSQMSPGQWPAASQGDVAHLPPCTRGINRRQPTDSLEQTFAEIVRQEKQLLQTLLLYRYWSGSWRDGKDTTVLMFWSNNSSCIIFNLE